MSHNPLIPAKPVEITLDTLPQLFAHHKAKFGGWSMTATPLEPDPPAEPTRPEGISDEEWNALGDPGKRAIVRERERADTAERTLAASRARPAPPKADPPKSGPPKQDPPKPQAGEVDIEAIVKQAVSAAVQPFQEREARRDAESAAGKVTDAVLEAAKSRLHDATDALTGIDLTTVVNDQGLADTDKIKTALDDLVTRKPHLAKTGTERQAPPGIGGGAPAAATEAEKVKAVLADMQRATSVRPPAATTN